MADLVDRHELRVALEKEESIAKERLGANAILATAFFEIVYRTLNKMPFPKSGRFCSNCGSLDDYCQSMGSAKCCDNGCTHG